MTVPGKTFPPSLVLCLKSKYSKIKADFYFLSVFSLPQNTQVPQMGCAIKGPDLGTFFLHSALAADSQQARGRYWNICSFWFGLSCRTKGSICIIQDLCCLLYSEPASTVLKLHQKSATGRLEWYNTARQLHYPEFPLHLKYIVKNLKQEMGYLVKFQMMLLSGITSAHARIHRLPSSPENQFNCTELLLI